MLQLFKERTDCRITTVDLEAQHAAEPGLLPTGHIVTWVRLSVHS